MSICALCAQPTLDDAAMCRCHLYHPPDGWATGNRIMCDFLHRGIIPPTPDERLDRSEPVIPRLEAAIF
jgi:hypothetical protein